MTTLAGWSAIGETFQRRDYAETSDYVQVSIHREVLYVPSGKKRAVKSSESVLRSVVMARDAWEKLSSALQIAGCDVTTRPRSW